jgi:hypothetical protein
MLGHGHQEAEEGDDQVFHVLGYCYGLEKGIDMGKSTGRK